MHKDVTCRPYVETFLMYSYAPFFIEALWPLHVSALSLQHFASPPRWDTLMNTLFISQANFNELDPVEAVKAVITACKTKG